MRRKTINKTIYTDGSCWPNPGGCGGYAAILIDGDNITVAKGNEPKSTNNRMELTAIIEGLKLISKGDSVVLYTDSKYALGFVTGKWRKPVGAYKNPELVGELRRLVKARNVQGRWVKAHDGNEYNEQADQLAEAQRMVAEKLIEEAIVVRPLKTITCPHCGHGIKV